MKLQLRIILVSLAFAVAVLLGITGLIHKLLSLSFRQLQSKQISADLERCQAAINREARTMAGVCQDYASWDDTYEFAAEPNEEYIASNLSFSSFENLEINLLYIFSREGEVIWGKSYDLAREEELSVPTSLPLRYSALSGIEEKEKRTGLAMTSLGPMLLTAQPILTTQHQGPPRGTMVFGKIMNAKAISRLQEQVGVDCSIQEANHMPSDLAHRLEAGESIVASPERAHRQVVFTSLPVLLGSEPLVLSMQATLSIIRQGREALMLTSAAAAGLILVLLALQFVLVRRMIVTPLVTLTRAAARTEQTLQAFDCAITNRPDELGALARSFSSMTSTLLDRAAQLSAAKAFAEEASRIKSSFVSNVSHEIRTPLGGIIGFAELASRAEDLEDARSHARTILKVSDGLLELINDLLDHAKIEHGKLELEEQPTDLAALLASLHSTMKPQATKKGLAFELEMAQDTPAYVYTDKLRLRQILTNLLSNAIKFTSSGAVTLAVTPLDRLGDRVLLRFSVTDTGIGIPKERQSAIFESFSQADTSMTRRFGGTGLGTTIARSLATLMGGQLTLESEPGVGSTFTLTLPLLLSDETQVRHSTVAPDIACPLHLTQNGSRQAYRVLVAEDYPVNQQIVLQHLSDAGYDTTLAEDGQQAVELARASRFDLVLMDLQMPRLDGIEATRAIRANGPNAEGTPILAMTASAEAAIQASCLAAGMDGVLTKPLKRRVLLENVARSLRQGRRPQPEDVDNSREPARETSERPLARPPLDEQLALELFGDNRDLFIKALRALCDRLDTDLFAIEQAAQRSDNAVLRRHAHKIKGGAACVGATALSSLAAELETDWDKLGAQEAADKLAALRRHAEDLKEWAKGKEPPKGS